MNQDENKIKILDFSPYYSPHIGGLERYAEELHENLVKNNCQITVFTPHIPDTSPRKEIRNGITIIRYPAWEIIFNFPIPCFWRREFWHQYRLVSFDHFDLAISTSRFFIQPLIALIYSKIKRIPILHIEHGSDFVKGTFLISLIARIFDYTLGWLILKNADRIIAPSKSAEHFIKLLSGRESTLIYRGMPFAEIDVVAPNEELKNRFQGKKIISYIGRLIYGKGLIHLFKAIKKINRDDVVVLIVGDGGEMENLKKYVKNNSLEEKILFLGSMPFTKAMGIMKITDIFAHPSYNEGLPTSVLEAGVCRIAIAASDVGGTPEIVTNQQSALLFKPYSSQNVFNALEQLLDNPERRKFLRDNARKEIELKFNWKNSIDAYLKEIKAILKK